MPVDDSKALAGTLALLAEAQELRVDETRQPRRTELILHAAGLTAAEIAALLGKKESAVSKAISRARAAQRTKKS